ncbi:MAG: amino acid transporter, partial [Chloroflexi bacterium]|nr:amino acid transporter [Chloroflexota bacterium]
TGVDYFSTLGYQPGIAFLAAGALSPIATIILVIVTLFGALPIYQKVANESPHGEGSILMLRGLLSRWRGKTFILFLLGFAATDFIITITLSAADATAHLVENPILAPFLHEARVPITLFLIAILGAVFLKGFNEAIGVAVVLVISYLILNAIVIGVGLLHVLENPKVLFNWQGSLSEQFGNPIHMVIAATLLFPKLALGGRIRNARKLLTVAAVIMSVYLITSSIVTTTLIPAPEFALGGKANGRALAYLAYEFLGTGFGSVYDAVTIAILWFAGASAMAGLLNLIPNYLPKYGMAPQFYATGVLVLMMSGAFAVTLKYREEGRKVMVWFFSFITFVFIYTLIVNVLERPDGVKIASVFIASIIAISMLSRAWRSTELRTSISTITADEEAMRIIEEYRESDPNQRQGSPRRELIHLICDRPRGENAHMYDEKR